MSPAFLEALSMALRRAEISQAWPSARACFIEGDELDIKLILVTRGQGERGW